jgi:hypothetical protein
VVSGCDDGRSYCICGSARSDSVFVDREQPAWRWRLRLELKEAQGDILVLPPTKKQALAIILRDPQTPAYVTGSYF